MKYIFVKMHFEHWKGIVEDCYDEVYEGVKDKVEYATKGRRSCLFALHEIDLLGKRYGNSFSCKDVPDIIKRMRTTVELLTNQVYDYVLVHIYLTGESGIAYHADRECESSTVCSCSFGAPRKFRLRRIEETQGFDHEFILGPGDVFLMKPGCQTYYQHAIIPEKRITDPRINLTFRQYEI
jgi:hypothetical protein